MVFCYSSLNGLRVRKSKKMDSHLWPPEGARLCLTPYFWPHETHLGLLPAGAMT